MAIGTAMAGCAVEPAEPSVVEQPGITMQGITMQGITMQGITMQGMSLRGFNIGGANLDGAPIDHVRVERGELVAERAGVTLRGTGLIGAHLLADARGQAGTPLASAIIEYRITAITPELPQYDPTQSGNTYLYTIEQWVGDTGTWQAACPADSDGRRVAIPIAATWDDRGGRVESSAQFTFGCTFGVIAKCYRWGYRPWLTGYGADMAKMHQACTRMARADYCGIGLSHTRNGTTINVWDNLPAPGPIQKHGLLPPLGMLFEAGWDANGAVCLSHSRWLLDDGLAIAALCPERLVPLGLLGTICDTVPQVLSINANAVVFNEAYLNLLPL